MNTYMAYNYTHRSIVQQFRTYQQQQKRSLLRDVNPKRISWFIR